MKSKKVKFLALAMAAVMVFEAPFWSGNKDVAHAEENGSMTELAAAQPVSMGEMVQGIIDKKGDTAENSMPQCYSFAVPSAGLVKLDITAYLERYSLYLYDNSGSRIYRSNANEWTESVGYRKDAYDLYLEEGNYYIKISSSFNDPDYNNCTGTFQFRMDFTSSGTTNRESDNSFAAANPISMGDSITGQISINDDFDTYAFTLNASGRVAFDITAYMRYYCLKIFDSDGKELFYKANNEWNENVGYRRDTYKIDLERGSYYLQINGYRNATYDPSTGIYKLATSYTASNAANKEADNSFDTATPMQLNQSFTGQIALNDDYDTYKIDLTTGRTYQLSVTSYMPYYMIYIFDKDGKEIWYTDNNPWDGNVGYRKDNYDVTLAAGTYYIQVSGYRSNTYDKSTGTYQLKLGSLALRSIKLSAKSITLIKGEKYQLNYTLQPSSIATSCKWKSSNKRVATVKNGLIKAKKKGTAIITVTTREGKKATCKVRVKKR